MSAVVEALTERIRQALDEGEAMQCTRVWEAWHYRTMSDEDFVDASDGPLAEDIAAAVLPIVESMVRKEKAKVWDEATKIALNFAYLNQEDRTTLYLRPPYDRNPYTEETQ